MEATTNTNPGNHRVDRGHKVEARKVPVRTAYARNGNTHRPTIYYQWHAYVDGVYVGFEDSRREAFSLAADYITIDLGETA